MFESVRIFSKTFLPMLFALVLVSSGTADSSHASTASFPIEEALKLDSAGLEKAYKHYRDKDIQRCRAAVADYFIQNDLSGDINPWPGYKDAVARTEAILRGEFKMGNKDAFRLPADLAWNENPSGILNWQFLLLAFDFFKSINSAYRASNDPRYLLKGKELIIDFTKDNCAADSYPSRFSWTDHSAAYRAIHLIDFWRNWHESGEDDGEFTLLLIGLIWRHAVYIAHDKNYAPHNNHGMFENVALYRIAAAFPEFNDSGGWKKTAVKRFEQQIKDNYTPDGVEREYSPGYQIVMQNLIATFMQDCEADGDVDISGFAKAKYKAMKEYIPYIFHPDGFYSLLGDTRALTAENALNELPMDDPYIEYMVTGGKSGRSPVKNSKAFPNAQIYVMRSGWGEMRSYDQESYLIADFGEYGISHQHDDFLTFELSARGQRWITDLGAYSYNPGMQRSFIISAAAHNIIVPYSMSAAAAGRGPGAKLSRKEKTVRLSVRRIKAKRGNSDRIGAYERLLKDYTGDCEDLIRLLLAVCYVKTENGGPSALQQVEKIIKKGPHGDFYKTAKKMHAALENGKSIPDDIEEYLLGADTQKVLRTAGHDKTSRKSISNGGGKPGDKNLYGASLVAKLMRGNLPRLDPDRSARPAVDYWISNDSFDYLEGSFEYRDNFKHARAILFIKPYYFIILDRAAVKSPYLLDHLFHMPPEVSVRRRQKKFLLTSDDSLRCVIMPLALPEGTLSRVVTGKNKPRLQGWYGGVGNVFMKAPVIENAFVAKRGNYYLANLILPLGGDKLDSYGIIIKNSGGWRPGEAETLKLTIEEPGYLTDILYGPSSKITGTINKQEREPVIEVHRRPR